MKKFLVLMGFMFMLSCSPQQKSKPQSDPAIGMPKPELMERLESQNVYRGVKTSQVDTAFEEISTNGDEKYFLKSGKVVSKIRNAHEKERALAYWREKFKGNLYRERSLTNQQSMHGHQGAWIEFACDALGTGVIFDPVREQVVKVFYYEHQE